MLKRMMMATRLIGLTSLLTVAAIPAHSQKDPAGDDGVVLGPLGGAGDFHRLLLEAGEAGGDRAQHVVLEDRQVLLPLGLGRAAHVVARDGRALARPHPVLPPLEHHLSAFLAARLEFCPQPPLLASAPAKPRSVGALKDLGQVLKVAPTVRIF